jgi:hypothetical protein
MAKWEYKTVKVEGTVKSLFKGSGVDLDKPFNDLGQQGWELVSVIGLATGGSAQSGVQAVFKRQIA